LSAQQRMERRFHPDLRLGARIDSPKPSDVRPFEAAQSWQEQGGYYGYHWWGLTNSDGTYDYAARGHLGQIIYVAPRKNMVVVRFGGEADSNVIWSYVIKALVDQMP